MRDDLAEVSMVVVARDTACAVSCDMVEATVSL